MKVVGRVRIQLLFGLLFTAFAGFLFAGGVAGGGALAASPSGPSASDPDVDSRFRVERTPVANGAELIAWIETLPDGRDLPILAVLNDTLSHPEPEDDRLRQVWVFTWAAPSLGQRAQSAVPFLYHRLWSESAATGKPPHAILDMGAPSRGVWLRVAMSALQAEVINPAGALARLTTRSYGGNLGEYKTTHVWEALDLIPPAGARTKNAGLDPDELRLLESRLELSGKTFSGLVSDKALPDFYEEYQTRRTEIRGHNWELLRQSAEESGLYFEPLSIGGVPNAFAMVTVARNDLPCAPGEKPRHFDGQFLKIESPFSDSRLCRWTGYSESAGGDGNARIPLALYSLDYPGVPLLLVDFRRAGAPSRSEMTLRAADDVTAGVLGLTGFGLTHLGYRALKTTWLFVHSRHGSATNRALRRRAFVQLRHAVGADDSLDPQLRTEISKRVEKLDIDPLERSWDQEVRGAQVQYEALLKYACEPEGLPRLVHADREQEARAMAHGAGARALLRVATISTFGIYRHEDGLTPGKLTQMAARRRASFSKRNGTLPDSGAIEAGE